MSALLFLHEVGDADGPRRWRALGPGGQHRWPGAVLVPDLPGHGVVPPEEGAYYAPGDVALVGVRALAAAGLDGAERREQSLEEMSEGGNRLNRLCEQHNALVSCRREHAITNKVPLRVTRLLQNQ